MKTCNISGFGFVIGCCAVLGEPRPEDFPSDGPEIRLEMSDFVHPAQKGPLYATWYILGARAM